MDRRRAPEETVCDGVHHFDGVTWVHYLSGMCVDGLDVADDESVWVAAGKGNKNGTYRTDLSVITPEAVAATE